MELHDALLHIHEIRAQLARTQTFRGYRSLTVGLTGLIAIGAGLVQAVCIPRPQEQIAGYLWLWVSAAALSVVVAASEMALRCRRDASLSQSRVTWLAAEQFLPCLFAGGLLTAALYATGPDNLWMLPGLWAIVFSLGVFASWRLLPRPTFWIGAFYLIAGGACLLWARGEFAFTPWAMIGTFGGGQLLAAAILYYTLERKHEPV
ncbi:MAG: hypothetical protein WD069_02640 [Planctomycetales bacterium]